MLAYVFVVIAVACRLMPNAALSNFMPVGAALLLFGARQPRRQMWIPVALFAASDVVLSYFVYHYPLTPSQVTSWLWYAGAILIGGLLRDNARPARVLGAALASSLSFFAISNFAVWLESPFTGGMYPLTWSGLAAGYTAAGPFFPHTLASDLIFTAVFFGIAAVVDARQKAPVIIQS